MSAEPRQNAGFTQGLGSWLGCAEVYSGEGRFLGNGTDTRQVQALGDGRTRIDVSFIGPLKTAGHYFIQDNGDHRLYQGPLNVGYADVLDAGLVDANAYWASVGLTQRFFLMVAGDRQYSLALMSRGEQVIYAIVGENQRITSENPQPDLLLSGTSYDLADDPTAGRDVILLHRPGRWSGTLKAFDQTKTCLSEREYLQNITPDLQIEHSGSAFADADANAYHYCLHSNGWQAWTPSGTVVGSYNLMGGRALSGTFYHQEQQRRCWRREVVAQDGESKAVLYLWYRGAQWIGYEYGVLHFTPEDFTSEEFAS
jgi:hypothetical protein